MLGRLWAPICCTPHASFLDPFSRHAQQRIASKELNLCRELPLVPYCCMQMLLQMSNVSSVWIFKGQRQEYD